MNNNVRSANENSNDNDTEIITKDGKQFHNET